MRKTKFSTEILDQKTCTENLSLPNVGVDQDHTHTKRQFFYVKKADVNRNLPESANIKQLKVPLYKIRTAICYFSEGEELFLWGLLR